MFGKSIAIVFALGLMATALLALRHQRFEQVAEISRGHWRLQEQERDIGRRRAAVATAVKPDAVRKAIAALKLDWQPRTVRRNRVWPRVRNRPRSVIVQAWSSVDDGCPHDERRGDPGVAHARVGSLHGRGRDRRAAGHLGSHRVAEDESG
jgi:hypothetical protein